MREGPRTFNPYVGPRPFEFADREDFFGRDSEILELEALVIANPILLFYAESGAGKSSLLNAGLKPHLQENDIEVLPIARPGGALPEGIDPADVANIFSFNAMLSLLSPDDDPAELLHTSLPEFLEERLQGDATADEAQLNVLIFDQFEEVFTGHLERWAERKPFFGQLADLLKHEFLRVVISIREDYLAQLDPFAGQLPGRLRSRFRLERLREETALAAITRPAEGAGRSFEPGVAERLVDELLQIRTETGTGESVKVKGEFVEPVQLQVVCHTLWHQLPEEVDVISETHRKRFGDVDKTLSNFYENIIRRVVEEVGVHPSFVRDWCEDALITTTGTRSIVHRGPESTAGLPNEAVDLLQAMHLLQSAWRAGARWYELTHDRFIMPIRDANARWRKWCEEQRRKAYSLLQRAERKKDRPAEVARLSEKALAISQEIGDVSTMGLTFQILGDSKSDSGSLPEALEAYEKAYIIAVELGSVQEALQLLMAMGAIRRSEENYDEALKDFTEYTAIDPDSSVGYAERAFTHWQAGQFTEAVEDYRLAIERAPESPDLLVALGGVYYSVEDLDGAVSAYLEAISLDPRCADGYAGLGYVHERKGNLNEACTSFQRAIELEPGTAHFHNELGGIYARMDREDEAIEEYLKSLEMDPRNPETYYLLGYLERSHANFDKAIAFFQQALVLKRSFAAAYIGLGGVYRRMERYREAIEAYENAIELGSANNGLARASVAACYRLLGDEEEYARQVELARGIGFEEDDDYNRACFEALCGNSGEAVKYLKRALERKQTRPQDAGDDIDFDFIRDDPRFLDLVS